MGCVEAAPKGVENRNLPTHSRSTESLAVSTSVRRFRSFSFPNPTLLPGVSCVLPNGNARAFAGAVGREAVLWDNVVPGFGPRARPNGDKTWIVLWRYNGPVVWADIAQPNSNP